MNGTKADASTFDQNGTRRASYDAVTQGEIETYWIDMNIHVAHCAYSFCQIYHAYQQGKGLGAVFAHVMEEDHFYHCLTFMSSGSFTRDAQSTVSLHRSQYVPCDSDQNPRFSLHYRIFSPLMKQNTRKVAAEDYIEISTYSSISRYATVRTSLHQCNFN
jgi:hypothetical protein